MFNFLLSAADGTALSLGDKLSIGGQVTLLGMGTVFAILALLWGLVELLHVILKPFAEKKTGTFNPPPVVAPGAGGVTRCKKHGKTKRRSGTDRGHYRCSRSVPRSGRAGFSRRLIQARKQSVLIWKIKYFDRRNHYETIYRYRQRYYL